MVTSYTESMFSLFSLLGMYHYVKKERLSACLFFSLATATRGNGIALAGFFMFQFLIDLFHMWKESKRMVILSLFRNSLYCVVTCLPYVLFQIHGYNTFCTESINDLGSRSGMPFTDYIKQNHPWCLNTIPHLYSYVQSEYWNVGLFKYYEMKQVPNFLLASPIVSI